MFWCFINIQKDADEQKLTQTGRMNIAIYATNLRYVLCTQIPTIPYAHGEWECLQSKFVNCCYTMSWKGWFDQAGSLVLFNRACRKSMTGFSHAPLETAFSLHRGNTAWPQQLFQLPVIIACNFTCSKVILSGNENWGKIKGVMTSQVEVPPLTGLIHFFSGKIRVNRKPLKNWNPKS